MQPTILIAGSSNTDMVIKTNHIPLPGETVIGGSFFMNAGGKGANQAVAAARLGGNIVFICKTGDDIFGQQAKDLFNKEGIDTRFVLTDTAQPSGAALIMVDEKGENCIAVASGANAALQPADIQQAHAAIETSAIVLMQLEIPLATVTYIASIAESKKIKLILNPAPACELPDELLSKVAIITPNESEAEKLTGIKVSDHKTAALAAQALKEKGIATVIITMGAQGVLLFHENKFTHVASLKVEAVDTTAAGDVFNGALAVALAEGKEMEAAVSFACKAAALSVTRLGAQASAPNRNEVDVL
jgi:ribokinase